MAIRPSERYVLSYQDQELWERGDLSLKGVKAALARRDPRLAEYIVKLVQLDPALPEEEAKQHKGIFGYSELISELGPWRRWQSLNSRCEALGLSLYAGEINRNKLREVIAEQ
mgnify:CR=1 FL=1